MKKLLFAVTVGLLVLVPLPAHADSQNALGISPIRNEVTVAAGTTYASSLVISNTTKQTAAVDMYAQIFNVIDQNYTYSFSDSSPFNQWVHFSPSSFDLASGQTQKVNYTIGVPVDATPGGKYFSLFAATSNGQNQAGISTAERVGSLVYLTVPGDMSHKGSLLGLNVPTIAFSTINWSEKVNNTGANYFRSQYTVTLQSLFGKTITRQQDSALIISSSIRLVTGQLAPPAFLGLYKVSATFSLGDAGSATDSRWVLYLPLSQLMALFVIIIVIVILLTRLKKRRSKKQD